MGVLRIREVGKQAEEGTYQSLMTKRAMRRIIRMKDDHYNRMKVDMEENLDYLFKQMDDHTAEKDRLKKQVETWKDRVIMVGCGGAAVSVLAFIMGMHG